MKIELPQDAREWGFLVLRLAVLAALVAGVDWVGDRLDLIRGNSIPYSVAWIEGGPVHKGDYVYFEARNPIINNGVPSYLTKQVVCVAGELIHFDGERWFCGQTLLGGVIRETRGGRDVPVARVDGAIPAGKVFVLGSHPRSFDSRYLGLLDENKLTVVRPLW